MLTISVVNSWTCTMGCVQNQLSDDENWEKNHDIKSKLAQKLYDENI